MSRSLLLAFMLPAVFVAADASASRDASAPVEMPSWAASLPSDDAITDDQRDAIQQEARAFAKAATPAQKHTILAFLSHGATCGRAHAAALAGIVAGGVDTSALAEAITSASTACNEVVVEAAGFAPRPDEALAASLLGRTLDGDEAVRRAAWLAYGSIAETARVAGNETLARGIDGRLLAGLATTRGEEHVLRVRAAGNAGCAACAGVLAADAMSDDVTVRRAAVAAHRFLPSAEAVTLMCDALANDADTTARDLSAWALEWRGTSPELRADCLAKAATADRARGVRLQAVRALGVLADDADAAHEALARLAQAPGDVGDLALDTLLVKLTPAEDKNPETRLALQ